MTKSKSSVSAIGTIRVFLKVGACSTTLCNVLDHGYGHPLELEERAALSLAGGIVPYGYQCGQIWGAALGAGAQAYHLLDPGSQAESAAILAAGRLIACFRARNKEVNCLALTNTTWQNSKDIIIYLLKGGPIRCFLMAGDYAPAAFREINASLSEKNEDSPCSPVSCAAVLARMAGLSDLHTVMAAGLAGGIGLSGGACGALGAAIWINKMKQGKEGAVSFDFDDPWRRQVIEGFLSCTNGEFECEKIAGRKFESTQDHADYIRMGGCAKIIEELASHLLVEEIKGGGNS